MKERNGTYDISMTGHAQSGEYGKDIVCAAISAYAYFLAEVFRSLQKGDEPQGLVMDFRPGLVRMQVPIRKETEHTIRTVIHAAIGTIQALERQYPQAVKLCN